MRAALAIILLSFVGSCAQGDDAPSDDPIPWQTPFEAISASKAGDAVVLVLITNEDPFATASVDRHAEKSGRPGKADQIPFVWCAEVMGSAYRRLIDQRRDLRGRVTIQSISAGMPSVLTGGQDRNTPARAVLAICDGNYRLLALGVGVPDADDLLTLIEDAQDVATVCQQHADDPAGIVNVISVRSGKRLSRLWRGALEEMMVTMQGNAGGDDVDAIDGPQTVDGQIQLLSESFTPTYLSDVRLRFGLTDAADRNRLVILEQHLEARRPWCEAMIPFVAGKDFLAVWRELVESVWAHPPVIDGADASDLLEWFDLLIKNESVVLSLSPPLHLRHLPWPPINDAGNRRGVAWQEVHALAMEHQMRSVDAQHLAALMHSRDFGAIDIERPSRARYLILDPKSKLPQVIREGDPPGRAAARLKRTKTSLVRE